MQKPLNKDIYKVLKSFEDGKTPLRTIEDFYNNDKIFLLVYDRLQTEKYISIIQRERREIIEKYKDEIAQSYVWEEYITRDWKLAPEERFDKKSDQFVVLTTEWKMFLNNYSKFWKRMNYRFEDYHIIMPLLFGFLWGIVSSLILYFIIWR